jgi:hypothetical protein
MDRAFWCVLSVSDAIADNASVFRGCGSVAKHTQSCVPRLRLFGQWAAKKRILHPACVRIRVAFMSSAGAFGSADGNFSENSRYTLIRSMWAPKQLFFLVSFFRMILPN